MNNGFFYVPGLKAFCSECKHGFQAGRKHQGDWRKQTPVACPNCRSLQWLPQGLPEELRVPSNLGMLCMIAMVLVSIFNIVFLWHVLQGNYVAQERITMVMLLSPLLLFVLARVMKSAIGDLRVQLVKHDSP